MRIIDLFSGAGGLTFGFYYRIKQNKFVRNRKNSFVFANELDPFAAEAFKANFPDIRMINEDIKQLDKDVLVRRKVLDAMSCLQDIPCICVLKAIMLK